MAYIRSALSSCSRMRKISARSVSISTSGTAALFYVDVQGIPDTARALSETDQAAAAGRIDAPGNLARQRIRLFAGFNDGVVKRPVMDSLYDYFRHYVPAHQIDYQNTLEAGHAMITQGYGDD